MNTTQFYVQDVAGNAHAVQVISHAPSRQDASSVQDETSTSKTYVLEDGSALTRVDNDTFQMAGTGAYLTLLRD